MTRPQIGNEEMAQQSKMVRKGEGHRTETDQALLKRIAINVREARTNARLSQRDLCKLCGMSQAYVSQVEAGNWNIGILNLSRIARVCGIDLVDLVKEPSPAINVSDKPQVNPSQTLTDMAALRNDMAVLTAVSRRQNEILIMQNKVLTALLDEIPMLSAQNKSGQPKDTQTTPLYIKDDATIRLVAQLAKMRGVSKQEAVKMAVTAELARTAEAVPLRERFARIRAAYPLPPPTGQVADKAFFDDLSGNL
jgi:antitoxin VapB